MSTPTGYSNILTLGASRNIGYHASLRFLALGATVTFLLRSTSVFDGNTEIQPYIKSGKAHLIQGDGLVQADVKKALDAAASHGPVDVVLFTVGGTPNFSLTKGVVLTTENVVTQCLLNVLCTIPAIQPAPKLITISSIGLTHESHKNSVPCLFKPFYSLLANPHKDKIGAERIISHCAGWQWPAEEGEPEESILEKGWQGRDGLPAAGTLKNLLVIRPAILTDGVCVAETETKGKLPYRVSETDIKGYTISRKDVAHFIVDAVTKKWDEYRDKRVNIVY